MPIVVDTSVQATVVVPPAPELVAGAPPDEAVEAPPALELETETEAPPDPDVEATAEAVLELETEAPPAPELAAEELAVDVAVVVVLAPTVVVVLALVLALLLAPELAAEIDVSPLSPLLLPLQAASTHNKKPRRRGEHFRIVRQKDARGGEGFFRAGPSSHFMCAARGANRARPAARC